MEQAGFVSRVQEVPAVVTRPSAASEYITMEGLLQVELNSHERDVLLRGLRYVRSAIMLELRDPEPDDELRRSGQLDQIRSLAERLEASGAVGASL